MSKASLVFGMGLMDSANTYALEQLVLDDEMVGGMRRARMGIKLGDLAEEMALIKSVGFTGDYLSADHTLRNFRSNWQPELMTRSTFNRWQQVGTNLLEKTRHRIAKILDQGGPPLLGPAVDRDLKNLLTEYGIVVPDDL
jgi:trimethylamine--corrinoid protein Co-methyltransferase